MSLIPLPYRILGLAIVITLFGGICWLRGANHVQDKWTAADNEMKLAIATRTIKQQEITTRVETKYVDRWHTIHDQGLTITKEVPVYVTAKDDSRCIINNGFVRMYNASIDGHPVPESPASFDESPSGIKLSRLGTVATDNNRICRETRQQLISLQEWVARQGAQ